MTTHARCFVLLIGAIAAGGCTHLPQTSFAPQSHAARMPPPSAASRFAEFQQPEGAAVDTGSEWMANSRRSGGELVRANWTEEAKGGPHLNPAGGFPTMPPTRVPPANGYPHGNGYPPAASGYSPGEYDFPRAQPAPAFPGGGTWNDPNGRAAPTATGQRLQLAANESATERAVLLAQLLETAQTEVRNLRERARWLEQQVQELEQSRADERQAAAQSAAELTKLRSRVEALNEEVVSLRERFRRLERQDLEGLQEIVTVLERLLDDPPRKAGR